MYSKQNTKDFLEILTENFLTNGNIHSITFTKNNDICPRMEVAITSDKGQATTLVDLDLPNNLLEITRIADFNFGLLIYNLNRKDD